jgi:hypothetical protein
MIVVYYYKNLMNILLKVKDEMGRARSTNGGEKERV